MELADAHVDSIAVEEFQQLLREAEWCFEVYEQFDDGRPAPWIQERLEQRRLAGKPIHPVPSLIKTIVWMNLRCARNLLSNAYYLRGDFEAALPLCHSILDQALRMPTEIWDEYTPGSNQAPFFVMYQLSVLYNNNEQYELARQWLKRLYFSVNVTIQSLSCSRTSNEPSQRWRGAKLVLY